MAGEVGWMSTVEVAAALGCTPGEVRRLARDGRLGQRRVTERLFLYDAEDVAKLQAEKAGRQRLPKRPRR